MLVKLFRRPRKSHKAQAAILFDKVHAAARDESFYDTYNVPDSFDGRFEALMLFCFVAMEGVAKNCEDADLVTQALFDKVFRNIDFALRESGVGDLGVPKHMKRMMKGFNGRYQAYQSAILCYNEAPEDLHDVLRRNIYGTVDTVTDETVSQLAEYIVKMHAAVLSQEHKAYTQSDVALFEKAA